MDYNTANNSEEITNLDERLEFACTVPRILMDVEAVETGEGQE